mmetsp:Transcript_34310/g.47906  ORF Transcript_34310/g.47906 Transcript_34310/m.47906 type:complete len:121 (-) Transcript_34310:61-423(-)
MGSFGPGRILLLLAPGQRPSRGSFRPERCHTLGSALLLLFILICGSLAVALRCQVGASAVLDLILENGLEQPHQASGCSSLTLKHVQKFRWHRDDTVVAIGVAQMDLNLKRITRIAFLVR